jgi:hypothetical protein
MLCTEFQDSVFNLPLVAHAWRRVGFEPLMLLLGDEWLLSTDRTTWNAMQVGKATNVTSAFGLTAAWRTTQWQQWYSYGATVLRCYGATAP